MAITSRTEGDVVVAGFDEAKMLDEALINEVGEELGQLANQNEGGKLLIDFSNVTFMSSSMIGKIVFLEKECKAKNIDLRLCSINSNVMEVFTLMNLDKILEIHDTSGDALAAFG